MTYSCGMAINFTVSVFQALVSDVLFQALVADNIRRYGEFPVPAIARGGFLVAGGCSGVAPWVRAGSLGSGWLREEYGCGGNFGVGVRGRTSCSVWPGVSVKMSWLALPGVRVKTFSAHVAVVLRLIVSGKRFSTHEESRVVFSPFVKILRFDIGDIDLYPIFVKK